MAPGYGHSQNGVNVANFRQLQQNAHKKDTGMGYRTPFEWQQETQQQVGLGHAENKQSSTLRATSNMLQNAAAHQVVSDLGTVENALRNKINHTEQLRSALQTALSEVMNEINMCVSLRADMEERLRKVQAKSELNQTRLQVRDSRPSREKTMDSVEKGLLWQQGMMGNFGEKVKRSLTHLDSEINNLDQVRMKLEADLRDKIGAIEVDTAVLGITPDGGADSGVLSRKHDALLKTPHTWERSTEDNVNTARHWLADAARLRKAIRLASHNSRTVEHSTSRELNNTMMSKINATSALKEDLERQLGRVRDEQSRAESQRSSLSNALEAKRGPLQQAKDRFNARKARPVREHVQDDVEAALANEIANLNAITQQLSIKVNLVDKEIAQLDLTASMLEDNIRDKSNALSTDERMVLLDGRINLNTPPPSTVLSGLSGVSNARTQTLQRIQQLEGDLVTARREREGLERNISNIKGVYSGSPTGPLSPTAFRRQ